MYSTDIDDANATNAFTNIKLNSFEDRCNIFRTEDKGPLIPLERLPVDHLDFTICNPPFFASEEEMYDSLEGKGKRKKPSAVCEGAAVEMITKGGDLGFVTRLVEESLKLKDKVTWYSSMFGKLSSCKAIVAKLREHGIHNYAVACLWGGSKTSRWAVAWSFGDLRPSNVRRTQPTTYYEFDTYSPYRLSLAKIIFTMISFPSLQSTTSRSSPRKTLTQ